MKQHKLHVVRGAGVDINQFTPSDEVPGLPTVSLPTRLLLDKVLMNLWRLHAEQIVMKDVRAFNCLEAQTWVTQIFIRVSTHQMASRRNCSLGWTSIRHGVCFAGLSYRLFPQL